MLTPALGAGIIGFIFVLIATISKEEKWQIAYGIVGLIFLFWAVGIFEFGRFYKSLIPPLTLLFGLFSFHTKGNTQLLAVIVTIILLVSI